ncbi:MAG: hypothetical protein R3211_07860 [Balneolaceae bacterium]|nr:hypothetical protein [Balneolaceae bacterium]
MSLPSMNGRRFETGFTNVIMGKVRESYRLGEVKVEIRETDHPEKLEVECSDGIYRSVFTIREYEYQNYKRHLNQRIKNAFSEQRDEE